MTRVNRFRGKKGKYLALLDHSHEETAWGIAQTQTILRMKEIIVNNIKSVTILCRPDFVFTSLMEVSTCNILRIIIHLLQDIFIYFQQYRKQTNQLIIYHMTIHCDEN